MSASHLEKTQTAAEGKSVTSIIVFVPLKPATLDDAVRDVLNRTDGDLLQDVTIWSSWWWIPYIYGRQAVMVTGDVYKLINADKGAN